MQSSLWLVWTQISILSDRQSNLKFNHLFPKREYLIIAFLEKRTGPEIILQNLGIEAEGGGLAVLGNGSIAVLLGAILLGITIVTTSG